MLHVKGPGAKGAAMKKNVTEREIRISVLNVVGQKFRKSRSSSRGRFFLECSDKSGGHRLRFLPYLIQPPSLSCLIIIPKSFILCALSLVRQHNKEEGTILLCVYNCVYLRFIWLCSPTSYWAGFSWAWTPVKLNLM